MIPSLNQYDLEWPHALDQHIVPRGNGAASTACPPVSVPLLLLESDLNYRFGYLTEFIGFGAEDAAAIHAAAAVLAPLVPTLVNAVYERLRRFDATWRHFLPRQYGYDGPVPESLEHLTDDHPMIRYRKEHLARYLTALVSRPYDGKLVAYLDTVGKMHTAKAGAAEIVVPLVQMNALLGFVADTLTDTILSLGLERDQEVRTLRAFNKLLWLQNDLINRHYQEAVVPCPSPDSRVEAGNPQEGDTWLAHPFCS